MNLTAAIAGIYAGAAGAFIAWQMAKRKWRKATAFCAIDGAALLNIVTFGHNSDTERRVVHLVSLVLVAVFFVIMATESKSRQRAG